MLHHLTAYLLLLTAYLVTNLLLLSTYPLSHAQLKYKTYTPGETILHFSDSLADRLLMIVSGKVCHVCHVCNACIVCVGQGLEAAAPSSRLPLFRSTIASLGESLSGECALSRALFLTLSPSLPRARAFSLARSLSLSCESARALALSRSLALSVCVRVT